MNCPHATILTSVEVDWCADCGARRGRSVTKGGEVLAVGEWVAPRPRRPDGTVHSVPPANAALNEALTALDECPHEVFGAVAIWRICSLCGACERTGEGKPGWHRAPLVESVVRAARGLAP
jgi:hypothetical protein